MSVEFSFFVSCRSKEEGLCEGIFFTFSTKAQKTKNQQQREDRKFEAKGRGLDKAVCLCVRGTADGQKNQCLCLSQEVH